MPAVLRLLRIAVLLSQLWLVPSTIAATISGRIINAATRKPIVFATVKIVETGQTSHTDADGRYLFTNLQAGSYSLAVTYGSYKDHVFVTTNLLERGDSHLNITLQDDGMTSEPTIESEDEHNKGIKSEFSIPDDLPGGSLRNKPIGLLDMPLRGYQHYIAIQPGTVRRSYDASVHVRGGRIDEFDYQVDGFSQRDPFSGRPFTAINGNTIDNVHFHPGYSSPLHGGSVSGRAGITTSETWATGGSFEAVTDNFHGEKSDFNLYALDLSGPLLRRSPGQLTYAVAGEHRTIGTHDPGGPGDWSYLGAWHANLRWRPSERTSTLVGTRGSYEDWKYTPQEWLFNSMHAPRGIDENYSAFARVEHDIARRTRLSASLNWFSASRFQGDGVHFDDLWAYGRPGENPRFDNTNLFYSWDDRFLDPDSLAVGSFVPLHTPVVESTMTVTLPDGETVQRSFIIRGDEGTVWDDFYKQKGSYLGGRVDLAHALSPSAETRVGAEWQRHTVRVYNHLFPVNLYQGLDGGYKDISRYGYDELGNELDEGLSDAKHPSFLGLYADQRLDLGDLTLNAGIRLDRFEYDTEGLIDPANPLDPHHWATYADTASGLTDNERDELRQSANELSPDELQETDAIYRLSPRLSAILPVSGSGTIHLSVGQYVQQPLLRHLYTDWDFLEYKVRTGGYNYVFGNGHVEPTRVWSYDVTWHQRISRVFGATLSAYQKDISDRIISESQPALPNSYALVTNNGSATVKGLALELTVNRTRGFAGMINYTLSSAEERGTIFSDPGNITWTNSPPRPVTAPNWYDQPHRFVAIADWHGGPRSGPTVGAWNPLANSGVCAIVEAGSGFPYTPTNIYNEVTLGPLSPLPRGPINSERSDWTLRVDLKANKSFGMRGVDLKVYLWVINLFNRDNEVNVYTGTGEPDNTGWLETPEGQSFVTNNSTISDASFLAGEQKYLLRQNDPANFDIGRQIRFGMRLGF